jgi:hypothetical protein
LLNDSSTRFQSDYIPLCQPYVPQLALVDGLVGAMGASLTN